MANQAAAASGGGFSGSSIVGTALQGAASGFNALSKSPAMSSYSGAFSSVAQKLTSAASSFISGSSSGKVIGNSIDSMTGYVSKDQRVKNLVAKMKANSAAWGSAGSNQGNLASQNEALAAQISQLLGVPVIKGTNGRWYIGSIANHDLLYERYHSGGIVGGYGSLQDNEAMAVLQNGEAVLSNGQKKSLYRLVDTAKEFGGMIGKLTSLFGGNLNLVKNNIVGLSAGTMTNLNKGRNGDITVDASVNINGDITASNWERIHQQLKEHQKQVAEIVNRETVSVYNRRGVAVF